MKRDYPGKTITISYDPRRCIHAEECVGGLAQVFDKNGKPWIQADGGAPERIAAVIQRCPTGALQYAPANPALEERPNTSNTITTAPKGPLYARGNIHVVPAQGSEALTETRVALCRCGASSNKPLCDGSHHKIGFADAGLADAPAKETIAQEEGPLKVKATPNGPLRLEGPFLVKNAAGEHVRATKDAWLCRCGASGNKPFCDGSHQRIGFQDS